MEALRVARKIPLLKCKVLSAEHRRLGFYHSLCGLISKWCQVITPDTASKNIITQVQSIICWTQTTGFYHSLCGLIIQVCQVITPDTASKRPGWGLRKPLQLLCEKTTRNGWVSKGYTKNWGILVATNHIIKLNWWRKCTIWNSIRIKLVDSYPLLKLSQHVPPLNPSKHMLKLT